MTTPTDATQPEPAQQGGKLLGHYAGYIATWAIHLGIDTGLFAELARVEAATDQDLAQALELDAQYTAVWCRSAYSAGILDRGSDGRYTLAPHMGTLLLDQEAPGYLGGLAQTFVAMRETFLDLREFMHTGKREWWNDFSPEWVGAVADTGQAFYRRMINVVLPQLSGVETALRNGGRVLDLACGLGLGPIKMATAYESAPLVDVDGDAYTLEVARRNFDEAGYGSRFELVHSMLEEFDTEDAFDLAIINISLHEARDMRKVVDNALRALRPGGTFIVNEFPFPETVEECRTLPAEIMSGIQFFESHIGCQLQPTSVFVELLTKAGFRDVGSIDVTPVHVTIHDTK
jgi:ubiquinone/menaquinone biosynthesis C-methylase UbiE